MKRARDLVPAGSYQKRLQEFDLREIDADDTRSLFHRKYMARLTWVIRAVEREVSPGATVLEIGCSQANASLLLAEAGYRTIGLDLRPQALEYARSKCERGQFSCVTASVEALPFATECFDAVILGELLEHCADPPVIVRECARSVKPGGIVVVTTPNGAYFGNRVPRYHPGDAAAVELAERQFGPAGEDHLFAFTLASLRQVLAAAGLEVIRSGYVGSAVYSDRLYRLKQMLSAERLGWLSHVVNRIPVLNRLLSYTLVATGWKR